MNIPTTEQPSIPSDARPSRRARVLGFVKWAFLAVAVTALAAALVSSWGDVSLALAEVGWLAFALATLVACVALFFNTLSWRAVMRAVGLRAPLKDAAAVFLVSQPGKYVPGAVWPVLAQAEFARSHHVGRSRALTGSIVAMVMGVATAGVVGVVGLAIAAPGSMGDYWWALVIAAGLVAIMTPPVLRRVVALALRVTRRTGETIVIGARPLMECAGWSLLNWIALGLHAWTLLDPLTTGSTSFALATGAFALAWLVGFLVVVAPAGIGAREAALVVLLATVATAPQALAIAVLSRFAMSVADAAGLVVGLALRPGKERAPRA